MKLREFQPTYLYIKQHSVTGKLYFGKTTGSERYLLEYYGGSGYYWEDHLRIHGNQIETIWYCLFYDREELTRFALMCSEQWDIVEAKDENGKKIWANVKPENGLDGGDNFSNMTEERYTEVCKKMSMASRREVPHLKGKTLEQINGVKRAKELREIRSVNSTGENNGMFNRTHSQEVKDAAGIRATLLFKDKTYEELYGVEEAERLKTLRSESMKAIRSKDEELICPYCKFTSRSKLNIKRWHFDNCKYKGIK